MPDTLRNTIGNYYYEIYSRHYSTTSFGQNVLVADPIDQMLEILSFCAWERN